MAENTAIEWCDHTFNPWIGCTKVSPGCDNCYAERREDKRLHRVQWGPGQPRQRTKNWGDPVKWNKQHEAFFAVHGRRQRVFCASLADVFDNEVPAEWRADLFALIDGTPHLDWLLLTKRIGNAKAMLDAVSTALALRETGAPWPPRPNVWLGATVVSQAEADRDIPKLLAVPARVHFLSLEPLLGPINLLSQSDTLCRCDGCMSMARNNPEAPGLQRIDWVICGGESGPGARPMHPDWARSLRDQCAAAGVPFLFKQWGDWLGQLQQGHPDAEPMQINASDEPMRVGKKAAGRLLDGIEHNGFPSLSPHDAL
jgi:protein gp37